MKLKKDISYFKNKMDLYLQTLKNVCGPLTACDLAEKILELPSAIENAFSETHEGKINTMEGLYFYQRSLAETVVLIEKAEEVLFTVRNGFTLK